MARHFTSGLEVKDVVIPEETLIFLKERPSNVEGKSVPSQETLEQAESARRLRSYLQCCSECKRPLENDDAFQTIGMISDWRL